MNKEFDFDDIGKKTPYRTPDNFFEDMQQKVMERTAAYPTGCFVSLSTTRPAKLPLPDCALTVIPDHNKTT
jgi:hypothetical protein